MGTVVVIVAFVAVVVVAAVFYWRGRDTVHAWLGVVALVGAIASIALIVFSGGA